MIQSDYQRNYAMRDNDLGIYCQKEKKFYYLETGSVYVSNTIDRIKKTLITRGLIEFTDNTFLDTERYNVMSCKDAKLKDYNMQAIYISKHVEQTLQEQEEQSTSKKKKTNWG